MIKLEPQHENIPDDVLLQANDFGARCLATQQIKHHKAVERAGGFYLFECICDVDFTIARVKILDFGGNFLCHPRSNGLRKIPYTSDNENQQFLTSVYHAGYSQNGNEQFTNEKEQRFSYPLIDDDDASFIINTDFVSAEWTDSQNYGNCWWIGEDGSVYSWRGTANRHFPLGRDIGIDGFTSADFPFYSAFSNTIYKEGAAIDTFEDNVFVVGAWEYNTERLCATITNENNGYWFTVLKKVGEEWVSIFPKERKSRPQTQCFVSTNGKTFLYETNLYVISDDASICSSSSTITLSSSGIRTIVGGGGYGSSYNYSSTSSGMWPELVSEQVKSTGFIQSAFFNTDSSGTSSDSESINTETIRVYQGAKPATSVTITANPASDGIVFVATPDGAYCTVSWSGVDSYNGLTAFKAYKSGKECGDSNFNVTVTINPGGSATWSKTDGSTYTPLTISRSGNQFSASGGNLPYKWSTDSGSITDTGLLTFSPTCQKCYATVTVTDRCNNSVSLKSGSVTEGPMRFDSPDIIDGLYPGNLNYTGENPSTASGDLSWVDGACRSLYTFNCVVACNSPACSAYYQTGMTKMTVNTPDNGVRLLSRYYMGADICPECPERTGNTEAQWTYILCS